MSDPELISKIMQNCEIQLFNLSDIVFDWEAKKELKEITLKFARVKAEYELWRVKERESDK